MPPPLNATDVVLGMLADDAPSSLRQALPSSVQQLIIRAMPGFTVPVPPAATPQQCAAWASLFDQECMRRTAGEGWALVPAQNGACEPPDAAASGRASSAVTACSPRVLVQLGASPALDAYASVAARVAAGWVAIVAVPRAADYARLRNASATVMRGDGGRGGGPQAAAAAARLRLHHAGVCARGATRASTFFLDASLGRGTNDSDLRCVPNPDVARATSLTLPHLMRLQHAHRPHTPRKCAACAQALGRPLPRDCLRRLVEGNLRAEAAPCFEPHAALVGLSRVEALLLHAPGAMAEALRAYPLRYLPPRRVVLADAHEPGGEHAVQRLRALGYTKLPDEPEKALGLQSWLSAAAAAEDTEAQQQQQQQQPSLQQQQPLQQQQSLQPSQPSQQQPSASSQQPSQRAMPAASTSVPPRHPRPSRPSSSSPSSPSPSSSSRDRGGHARSRLAARGSRRGWERGDQQHGRGGLAKGRGGGQRAQRSTTPPPPPRPPPPPPSLSPSSDSRLAAAAAVAQPAACREVGRGGGSGAGGQPRAAPACNRFCAERFARKHCELCKCAACAFCSSTSRRAE